MHLLLLSLPLNSGNPFPLLGVGRWDNAAGGGGWRSFSLLKVCFLDCVIHVACPLILVCAPVQPAFSVGRAQEPQPRWILAKNNSKHITWSGSHQ